MNAIWEGIVFGTWCWIKCLHILLIIMPLEWCLDGYCSLWAGNCIFNEMTILMNSLILLYCLAVKC